MNIKKNLAKTMIADLLRLAEITINGNKPWDVHIHNEQFYQRVLCDTDLGLGEAYMDGWWDCQRIDLLIPRLLSADIETKVKKNVRFALKLFLAKFFNLQTKKRSLQVGLRHYDLGTKLFQIMLDSTMNYSCGYWKNVVQRISEKILSFTNNS